VAILAASSMIFAVTQTTAASSQVKVKVYLHTGESVRCPRGRIPCHVTVRGETEALVRTRDGHGGMRRRRRMVRIGRASIRLAPASTVTLTLRLNRTGARLVLGRRRLSVRLVVAVRRGSARPIVLAHQISVAGQKRA
jgi:hypothetical protein